MFNKKYTFVSSKGYFSLIVSKDSNNVLVEQSPGNFISVRDLWPVKCVGLRDKDKIESIRVKHLDEFKVMIDELNNINNLEEQDVYIKAEMKSQGFHFIR